MVRIINDKAYPDDLRGADLSKADLSGADLQHFPSYRTSVVIGPHQRAEF